MNPKLNLPPRCYSEWQQQIRDAFILDADPRRDPDRDGDADIVDITLVVAQWGET